MKNFLMTDRETGEDFIVMAETKEEAMAIAEKYFEEPHIDDEITDFEAEMLGLDTYQERGDKMVPTNKMITEVDKKYGKDSKETLLMRLYVLSYKTNKHRTYADCLELYNRLIENRVDNQSTLFFRWRERGPGGPCERQNPLYHTAELFVKGFLLCNLHKYFPKLLSILPIVIFCKSAIMYLQGKGIKKTVYRQQY